MKLHLIECSRLTGSLYKSMILGHLCDSLQLVLRKHASYHDGSHWSFIPMEDWEDLFEGSIGRNRVYRIIKELEDDNFIETTLDFNVKNLDKTRYFTVTCPEIWGMFVPGKKYSFNTLHSKKGKKIRNLRSCQEATRGILSVDDDKASSYLPGGKMRRRKRSKSNFLNTGMCETHVHETIYQYWNQVGAGIKHRTITKEITKAISYALRKYTEDEIKETFPRLQAAYKHKTYFYSKKWRLDDFCTQKNGIRQWTDEGSNWETFKEYVPPIPGVAKQDQPKHKEKPNWKNSHYIAKSTLLSEFHTVKPTIDDEHTIFNTFRHLEKATFSLDGFPGFSGDVVLGMYVRFIAKRYENLPNFKWSMLAKEGKMWYAFINLHFSQNKTKRAKLRDEDYTQKG